jgi:malate dehydrogenase (oxaloacetate-decarboxylating)
MSSGERSLELHRNLKGKIAMVARAPVSTREELSVVYMPGIAQPCLEIQKDVNQSFELTRRWNLVAVITDGTAVLGLGDIGPESGMPVMEGKCAMLKAFGGVDAVPLCLKTKEVDEIVRTIYILSGSFGGVNLADISAPRSIEIERRLKSMCNIPIIHDDQHATAIVVLAALTNALRVVGKEINQITVITSGAGAAGIAVIKLLIARGVDPAKVIMTDRQGAIYAGREGLNPEKEAIARITNSGKKAGRLAAVLADADVFIGVSAPGTITQDDVRAMAPQPIIFAMANPTPEIMPDLARAAGAAVVGTGRSDFPNQINNVPAFPALFTGALDVRAEDINNEMNIAAANAIAGLVGAAELTPDYILPRLFDPRLRETVSKAVAQAAGASHVARI